MNGETEPLAEEHTVDRTQSILSSSVALLFTGSSSIDEDQRCCAALCCAVPSSVADQQHRKARAMVNFGRGNQYLSQSMERVFGV